MRIGHGTQLIDLHISLCFMGFWHTLGILGDIDLRKYPLLILLL